MLLDYNEKILCPSEVQVESEEISACSPFTPEAASVCLTYSLIIIHTTVPAIGIMAGNCNFKQN